MEKSRKRKEEEEEGMEEEEEDCVGINEEKIAEMMTWLEQEIVNSSSSSSVYSYPLQSKPTSEQYYYHSSPFVTINGNEETCGPSFSDTSSTVMATFDTSTAAFFLLDPALTSSDHKSTVNLCGSDPLWMQGEGYWLANGISGPSADSRMTAVKGLENDQKSCCPLVNL